MWRSSLIQSSLSAFLMLVLVFMLDFSFDYEIPSFRQGSIFLRRSMSMRARTEHGTPNIERRTSNAEPTLAQRKRLRLPISHLPSSIFQTLARVVEWQTRTFEGRMPKGMRVQVPPRAQLPLRSACRHFWHSDFLRHSGFVISNAIFFKRHSAASTHIDDWKATHELQPTK